MIVDILQIAAMSVGVLITGCTIAAVVGAGRSNARMEAIQASSQQRLSAGSYVERDELAG